MGQFFKLTHQPSRVRFKSWDELPATDRSSSELRGNLRGKSASLLTGGNSILAAKSTRSLSMKSFLAGLGIGIGLGILFAPMSGEETRENLTQRASDLADSARDLANQGRDKVRTTVSAIRKIT